MIDTCESCGEVYDDNDGYDGLCGCPDDGVVDDDDRWAEEVKAWYWAVAALLDAFATTGTSPPVAS